MRSRPTTFEVRLALVTGIALIGRAAYVLIAKRGPDACGQPRCGDAIYYSAQADTIAAGRWFADPIHAGPAADHPPLTALVAAPASWLFDNSLLAQRLTMVVIGSIAVAVIGLLGRRVAGDRVGLLAASIAAVYPLLWVNDGLVMAESITTLLVAAVLLAVYHFYDRPSLPTTVMLGCCCGLVVLARAEQALLVPVIVVPVIVWTPGLRIAERIGRLAVVGATAAIVIAPWVVHNATRFEEPVLLSTNDGLTLLGANCDDVYDGGAIGFWSLDCGIAVDAEGDQSEVSAARRDAAAEYVSGHQRRLPAVVTARIGRVWGAYAPDQMVWFNVGEGRERWVSWAGYAMYLALVPMALVGTVVLRRRRRPVWPLAGTAVVVTVTAALFYGIIRFRIPAEVALVVLASVALDIVWRRTLDRRAAPAS